MKDDRTILREIMALAKDSLEVNEDMIQHHKSREEATLRRVLRDVVMAYDYTYTAVGLTDRLTTMINYVFDDTTDHSFEGLCQFIDTLWNPNETRLLLSIVYDNYETHHLGILASISPNPRLIGIIEERETRRYRVGF